MATGRIEILVKDAKQAHAEPAIDVLLEESNFDAADLLLKQNVQLPIPARAFKDFPTKSEYFVYLLLNKRDLYIALRNNPNLANEQDENLQTLLHHGATGSFTNAHELLFKMQNLNFAIQDKDGNTPLHIAAYQCSYLSSTEHVFPEYLKAAARHNYDYSTLNKRGLSTLHIVTLYSHRRADFLEYLLSEIPTIDLNVLSASGSTALFYAVNRRDNSRARSLLRFGANPLHYGSEERNPMQEMKKHIAIGEGLLKERELQEWEILDGNLNVSDDAVTCRVKEEMCVIQQNIDSVKRLQQYTTATVTLAEMLPFFKEKCKSEVSNIVGIIADMNDDNEQQNQKKHTL